MLAGMKRTTVPPKTFPSDIQQFITKANKENARNKNHQRQKESLKRKEKFEEENDNKISNQRRRNLRKRMRRLYGKGLKFSLLRIPQKTVSILLRRMKRGGRRVRMLEKEKEKEKEKESHKKTLQKK